MYRMKFFRKVILLLFILFLSACGLYQKGGTYVWIDVPLNDLVFPTLQPIQIKGHASSPDGISRVEILVNSALIAMIEDPPTEDDLASFEALWSPTEEGDYLIQVVAYGNSGSVSEHDSAVIHFGGTISTETPQMTLTNSLTAVTPEASASATTTITTATSTSEPSGTITATSTATVTRTPIPSTSTPTITQTPPDITPPAAPAPQVPADGLSLSCRSFQSLVWLPVSDPSGISEYQVEFQRSSDNSNWVSRPGSPIVGIQDKTAQISTECGWYYRWRVRALDGVGNESEWSSWSYFTVNLE
ncbi:MAG: Ig-like domain-containing protein [Chloroflexota bacterium]|nr:Ig-like domain-containing protein [Chloroflexota bacterium]